MEVVLQQISKVQGVAGSFVCDEDGKLLGHTLPPIYDANLLEEAAGIIVDSAIGINGATGGVGSLDLRFSDSRIVVRTLQGGYLLLLCEQKINYQLLAMSLGVAQKKLEKAIQLSKQQPDPPQPLKQTITAAAPRFSREPRRDGNGVILVVDSMAASSKIQWDQTKEEASISQLLAQHLYKIPMPGPIKKLKLTNRSTNKSKVFTIRICLAEPGWLLDDRIALTMAAAEFLAAVPGDEITAESVSSGIFETDLVFAGL